MQRRETEKSEIFLFMKEWIRQADCGNDSNCRIGGDIGGEEKEYEMR